MKQRPMADSASGTMGSEIVRYGPRDAARGHSFAGVGATRADLAVLATMLARERAIVRRWVADGTIALPGRSDEESRRQYLVVPDWDALAVARDASFVGFFGQLRTGVDHTALFELEAELVDTFPRYAGLGLLSYYDLGAEHGRYGNLILFARPDGPELWQGNEVHRRATSVAPEHYASIRLHRGHVPGVFQGDDRLVLEHTTYLHFRPGGLWRAVRSYV